VGGLNLSIEIMSFKNCNLINILIEDILGTGQSTPIVGQRSNEMCGQTAYVKIPDIRLHWNVLLYDACESAEQTSTTVQEGMG
jgi:hypothetical protein